MKYSTHTQTLGYYSTINVLKHQYLLQYGLTFKMCYIKETSQKSSCVHDFIYINCLEEVNLQRQKADGQGVGNRGEWRVMCNRHSTLGGGMKCSKIRSWWHLCTYLNILKHAELCALKDTCCDVKFMSENKWILIMYIPENGLTGSYDQSVWLSEELPGCHPKWLCHFKVLPVISPKAIF